MLISEIRDNIAQHFSKPFDIPFKSRIKSEIVSVRAEVIKQHINKYGTYPDSLISRINATEMGITDIAESSSISIKQYVSVTKFNIPKPIRKSTRSSNFIYVGTIDERKSFGYIRPEDLNDLLIDRSQKNTVRYTYVNGKIYIFNAFPEYIRIKGIFSDPYKVAELNGCTDEDCPQDLDIPEDFVNLIERMVIDIIQRGVINPDKEEEVKIEPND